MAIIGIDTDTTNPYVDDTWVSGVDYYTYDSNTGLYIKVNTQAYPTPDYTVQYYVYNGSDYTSITFKKAWEKYLPKFLLYSQKYEQFLATDKGKEYFEEYFDIANQKIFKSVFGVDWNLAMSYCIEHYLTLASKNATISVGPLLSDVGRNDSAPAGVLSSASVGSFSKSYDLSYTTDNSKEAYFWNLTRPGQMLWALFKAKGNPTIFVVTSGPLIKKNNGGWW